MLKYSMQVARKTFRMLRIPLRGQKGRTTPNHCLFPNIEQYHYSTLEYSVSCRGIRNPQAACAVSRAVLASSAAESTRLKISCFSTPTWLAFLPFYHSLLKGFGLWGSSFRFRVAARRSGAWGLTQTLEFHGLRAWGLGLWISGFEGQSFHVSGFGLLPGILRLRLCFGASHLLCAR